MHMERNYVASAEIIAVCPLVQQVFYLCMDEITYIWVMCCYLVVTVKEWKTMKS